MCLSELLALEAADRSEHRTACHVMPIEQGVLRLSDFAPEVLKNRTGAAGIFLPVLVDIECIVLTLYHRIVHNGIRNVDPAHYVAVDLVMLLDLCHIQLHLVIICHCGGCGNCGGCRCGGCRFRCCQDRNRIRRRHFIRTGEYDQTDDHHYRKGNADSDQYFFQLFDPFDCHDTLPQNKNPLPAHRRFESG